MASPFYTAEHEAFRDVMRRFVAKEIEPFAHEWDEAGEFPRELYEKAAAIGLLGLGFPEEYGGVAGRPFHEDRGGRRNWRGPAPAASSASLKSHIHRLAADRARRARRKSRRGCCRRCCRARRSPRSRSPSRAAAPTSPICAPRRGATATTTSSTAKRPSSPRACGPTISPWRCAPAARAPGGVSLLVIEGDTPGLSRTKLKKMGWWASDTATLHFDELPRAGRKPDRRGGPGLQDHHAQFQQRAAGHGGRLHRLCARLPRGGDRLRQAAPDLRQAAGAASGDPAQAGRHGAEGGGDRRRCWKCWRGGSSTAKARSPKSAC